MSSFLDELFISWSNKGIVWALFNADTKDLQLCYWTRNVYVNKNTLIKEEKTLKNTGN